MSRARAAGWLAAALAACIACQREAPPEAPAPPSFVLVVADALRADRLQHAGHASARTPAFDALAAESVRFANAYAASSWTLPSTASLFLSQRPSEHRVVGWGSRLRPEQPTFVEALRRAGYRAGMWTANRIVAGERGFGDRFEVARFVEDPAYDGGPPIGAGAFGDGAELADAALAWLGEAAASGAPSFAYLHFMEPHGPFLCAEGASPGCAGDAESLNRRLLEFDWSLDAGQRDFLSRLYDADVERMDAVLGRLLRGLAERGLLETTWVVVVADHGELLGEADMYLHGRSLFEADVRVPLLFRPPAGHGALVETPVSLLDVAPTLLDLAGAAPLQPMRGRSLRSALEGRGLSARPVVSELYPVMRATDARQRHVFAVTDGETKFRVRTDGVLERFDLRSDARETHALPAERAAFEAMVDAAGAGFRLEDYVPDPIAPTREMRETLRQLGYAP